jgi:hypothetical protein
MNNCLAADFGMKQSTFCLKITAHLLDVGNASVLGNRYGFPPVRGCKQLAYFVELYFNQR